MESPIAKLKIPGQTDFFMESAFEFFRMNLQFSGAGIKTVIITSCYENEGKTTVSLGIGKSFANLGKNVLVIDADMRKSVITGRNLDVTDFRGLSEVITCQKKKEEVIRRTDTEHLYVLLAGTYPPNPAELLSSPNFETLLNEVREEYDYVFVDCPPLTAVPDAAIIAQKCDGAVLVVGRSEIKKKDAVEVVNSLKNSGTKILGYVRNDTHSKTAFYGKKKYCSKYGYAVPPENQ